MLFCAPTWIPNAFLSPSVRFYYRSHVNNPYPVIYDGSHVRPRSSRGALTDQTMSGKHLKRLEKLEKQLAEIATRQSGANCNCRDFTLAGQLFEAEMNQTCPVHGFRGLGQIMVLQIEDEDGNITEESLAVSKLVEEYKQRLARHRQQILEEDEPEEF
jgi:hypothetical protein